MTIFKHSHTSHHSHDTSRNKNSNSFQVSHKFFNISFKVFRLFSNGFQHARFPKMFPLHICHATVRPSLDSHTQQLKRTVHTSQLSADQDLQRPKRSVYCLLFTVYCLPFTVYCLLFTVYHLLFTVNCRPSTTD